MQSTKVYNNATVKIYDSENIYFEQSCDLIPNKALEFEIKALPKYVTVEIVADGKTVAKYTEKKFNKFTMPDVITDMPSAAGMNDADELYLAGVHVDQYRDPHTNPDSFWKEALKRKINHIPSLIAMAKYELSRYSLDDAENYIKNAIDAITIYNERVQSGDVYYTYGRILEAKGETDKAYDYYYKAYWAADSVAKAMTRIALIDIKRKDYKEAIRHAENALDYGRNNNLAIAALVIALREIGEADKADNILKQQLEKDSLDHLARYLSGDKDFYRIMDSDAVQTCLDIAFDLSAMGRYEDIISLLEGAISYCGCNQKKMAYYTLGYYKFLVGKDGGEDYQKAESAVLGKVYPVRLEEQRILEDVISKTNSKTAKMLLGCLLYNKLHYNKAAELWEQCDDYIARRNLAVAYFSHLNRGEEALSIMKLLVNERTDDEELLYETICLMDKMGVEPQEKIKLITSHKITRDDVLTELSKSYNQAFMPDKAIETLMSHNFVPCEGGEHAIADQYMFAYLVKGKNELDNGNYEKAIEFFREGQLLPQSLGAGIWNHCKLIPLKFHEAICLENTGEKAKADEIFRYIATTRIEYFSNMHLKELPYFQALSFDRLGEELKGQHLITKYLREWSKIKDIKDNGYFGTTPFFIPFVDEPQRLRKAQYLYLTGLCENYMGEKKKAKEFLTESVSLNNENMLAVFFSKFI